MINNITQEVINALDVINKGGIILYPTDTLWAIGCDATNEEAVKKIYQLKQRQEEKSMIVLVNNERLYYQIFKQIPEVAWDILDCATKPTTLVLDNPIGVAKNLIATDNSLGIRIVNEPFCFKLIERLKKPIVATSANISGLQSAKKIQEIDENILKGVDYIVNLPNEKMTYQPSTIIKLTNDAQVKIIRK